MVARHQDQVGTEYAEEPARCVIVVDSQHVMSMAGERQGDEEAPSATRWLRILLVHQHPEVMVSFTVIGQTGQRSTLTTKTDAHGAYRVDHIKDACRRPAGSSAQAAGVSAHPAGPIGGSAGGCFVSVADASGKFQDSRQVFLGNDPSTTTQDLDWGHIPDRHAVSGTITGPGNRNGSDYHGIEVDLVVHPRGQPDVVLGQTKPSTCGVGGALKCSAPATWRLEKVIVPSTASWVPAKASTVTADVELIEPSGGKNVIVDSANLTLPVDQAPPKRITPESAAAIHATDLTAPTLQSG
jgi:hypothetical protein